MVPPGGLRMSVSYAVVKHRDGQPVTYVVGAEDGAVYTYDVASGLVALVDELVDSWPRAADAANASPGEEALAARVLWDANRPLRRQVGDVAGRATPGMTPTAAPDRPPRT